MYELVLVQARIFNSFISGQSDFRDSLKGVDICASLLLWALEVVMTSKWSKMVLKRLQLIQHREVGLGIPGVRRCILAQVLSKDLAKRAQVPL